jgi:hypothetical protein
MMQKVDDDNTPQKDDAKGGGIADREKTPWLGKNIQEKCRQRRSL